MKLDTLVWAHMHDDTVRFAADGAASLDGAHGLAEDRTGGRVRSARAPGIADRDAAPAAAEVLASVEWMAIGFEIIDCVYPDWTFQPADFVAAMRAARCARRRGTARHQTCRDSGARGAAVAIHGPSLAKRRGGRRRLGQELAAQPGALSRGTSVRCRTAGRSVAARRGRSRQLRHADRVAGDCAGRLNFLLFLHGRRPVVREYRGRVDHAPPGSYAPAARSAGHENVTGAGAASVTMTVPRYG